MPRHAVQTLAVAIFVSFVCSACAAEGDPSARVKKFLGDPTVAVLQGATRVETFRLTDKRADDGKPSVGNYTITATGKEQGDAFAKRLAAILLDEKTYVFDVAKGCEFQAGVGYRVWAGERAVEVVICFKCKELIVHAPKAADGSVRGAMEDFDPAFAAMAKLAQEAFPEDKEIQALAEARN